jgi:hypothetical protein
MNTQSSSRGALAWLPLAALVLPLALSTAARADEPPVLLWGFQQGCDRMADVDRNAERALFGDRRNVTLLKTPSGQPLPACTGEGCAHALRAACPNLRGRILGGQGQEGKIVRTRLWLYDLSTGQIASHDDYCHACSVGGALIEHSRILLERPNFGPVPGPVPMYCAAPAAAARNDAATKKGPVFLSVYGDGKHKSALFAALRAQLEALGRTVLPVPGEGRSHSTEELEQIVAGQQNARVLSALVQKEGNVTVQLYDQKARLTDAEEVSCAGCGAETLGVKVKDAVADLLERCAGMRCADAVLSGAVQPPVAACEPFPVDGCASAALDAVLRSSGSNLVSGGLDPRTARIVKGLTWGGFAASAATGITLFALSGTAAGQYRDAQGFVTSKNLDGPAWTGLGLAAVLAGISIPVTIIVDRAVSRSAQPTSVSSGPAFIQCPN